jgi:hypothetical protein
MDMCLCSGSLRTHIQVQATQRTPKADRKLKIREVKEADFGSSNDTLLDFGVLSLW